MVFPHQPQGASAHSKERSDNEQVRRHYVPYASQESRRGQEVMVISHARYKGSWGRIKEPSAPDTFVVALDCTNTPIVTLPAEYLVVLS